MTKVPKTRIVLGEHFADILVRYSEDAPPVYYWICQKSGEAEILGMGTSLTFEGAEESARDCLRSLAGGEPCEVEPLEQPRFRVN